jgi:CBS domain-containing protein
MKVKDVMVTKVVTLKPSTTLSALLQLFKERNFHTLPVVDSEGYIKGVIDFDDVLKVFQPYGSEISSVLKTIPHLFLDDDVQEDLLLSEISGDMGVLVVADDLMNKQFVTVTEDTDVNEVRAMMKLHDMQRMMVAKDNRLVGIITIFDIVLAVFKEKGILK